MSIEKKKNVFWPEVSTVETAIKATKGALVASIVVACLTGALAIYGSYNNPIILGLDAWALIDSILFFIIAFSIWKLSRVGAVFGLLLYILERVDMWMYTESGFSILTVLFVIMYIHGIRGTFSYHKLKSQEQAKTEPPA